MTQTSTGETLRDLLGQAVRWKGHDVLFADEAEQLTAAAVDELVGTIASGLTEQGIGQGDRVAFIVGSSVRHALLFFACAQIGALPCALHTRDTAARLADAITWLGAQLLIADADRFELAEAARRLLPPIAAISLDDRSPGAGWEGFERLTSASPSTTVVDFGADDPAYIILSSGTTGTPKGIVHTHRTAWAAARSGAAVYGDIGRSDRLLIPMTPSFAAWVNLVLPFIAVRSTLVFHSRFDPAFYLSALRENEITYAALPPTLWRLVLREHRGGEDLPALRYVFFSGEPGSRDLIEALRDAFPAARIRQAWLSSEAGCGAAIVADHDLLVRRRKPTAAGLPVPGASLRVLRLDDQAEIAAGDAADPHEAGEIAVHAASVTPGYWGDATLSEARLANGWWRTGDVGHVDADGHVFITGRTDNVINTGGVKVHAEEIEAILLGHPGVHLAAVVGVPDPTWGSAIEAHVVRASQDVSAELLLEFCRSLSSVPAYKVPKRVVFHDALPMTATGKIFRGALRPKT